VGVCLEVLVQLVYVIESINNKEILHGDKTRCEQNFHTVDYECWRAISLRQLTFLSLFTDSPRQFVHYLYTAQFQSA